jgi:hypothetical protein
VSGEFRRLPPPRLRLGVLLAAGGSVLLVGCEKQTPATPTLTATCSATPSSGPAPLVVNFTLNVSGGEGALTTRINYGDGAAGTDVTAPHSYASPGTYTASITATTPTQTALCSLTVRVDPPPSPAPSPTPVSGPNQPPSVVFRTTPAAGPGDTFLGDRSLTIQFNLCQSSDPDGDRLNFRMDLDGDGSFEVDGPTGADCRRSRVYPRGTVAAPRLCATDLLSSLAPAHPYQCKSYSVRLDR